MAPPWPANAAPTTVRQEGGTGIEMEWVVPGSVLIFVESIVATINTDNDESRPRLTVLDNSGLVIAEKRQGSTMPALTEDRATWALQLADDEGGIREIISNGTISVTDPEGPTVSIDVVDPPSEFPRILATNTAAITFASGAPADITLDTVLNLVGDWTGHASYPTVLTVPTAGLYVVNATIRWFNEADTAFRSIFLDINGSFEGGAQGPHRSGSGLAQDSTALRYMIAGTTIELVGFSQAAGNVRIDDPKLSVGRVQ